MDDEKEKLKILLRALECYKEVEAMLDEYDFIDEQIETITQNLQ